MNHHHVLPTFKKCNTELGTQTKFGLCANIIGNSYLGSPKGREIKHFSRSTRQRVHLRVLFEVLEANMQSANAKKFRAELKDYMDAAVSEPVRINRRDGQSFVLMSEQIYEDFRNEIQSLQRRLLSMNEIIDGKTTEYDRNEDRLARFKQKK
jgi:PHD/YefM family antitoxin component YafN of YafNO toxin-antitoxin module